MAGGEHGDMAMVPIFLLQRIMAADAVFAVVPLREDAGEYSGRRFDLHHALLAAALFFGPAVACLNAKLTLTVESGKDGLLAIDLDIALGVGLGTHNRALLVRRSYPRGDEGKCGQVR